MKFIKTQLTALAICFAAGSSALSAATITDAGKEISGFFSKNPGKTVAVLAFKHSDAKAEKEVSAVQDRFIEQLVAAGAVTVIERDRMQQLLTEHQIDQSGATDKTRIGKLLQADYLLTGSI